MKKVDDWRNALQYFFLYTREGILLYSQPLKTEGETLRGDENLIGGFLSAINSFLEEITESVDTTKSFSKGRFRVLLEVRDQLILAVLVTKEIEIIREKMRNFLDKFLSLYGALIEARSYNSEFWTPTQFLVENYFQYSIDREKIKTLLDILEVISHVLLGTTDWGKVRKQIIEYCRRLVDAEICALYLKDDTGKRVCLEAAVGFKATDEKLNQFIQKCVIFYPIGIDLDGSDANGVTGYVAQTGKIVNVASFEEVKKVPGWQGKFDDLIWENNPEQNFRCLLAVPLIIEKSEIIGVLKVENKRGKRGEIRKFDSNDLNMVNKLATVIASATKVHQYKLASNFAQKIIDHLHPFDIFKNYIRMILDVLKVEVCALYAIDLKNNPKKLILVGGEGYKQLILPGSKTYDIGDLENGNDADGVTGWVAQSGKEAIANSFEEVQNLPRWKGKWDKEQWNGKPELHFRCMFAVPLKYKGQVIGVLKIENKKAEPSVFNASDMQTLRDIAQVVAEKLYKKLQKGVSLKLLDEYEYRLVRYEKRKFEKKAVGGVTIRHSLTSICPSEVDYFKHEKDPKKLDERLPMALGHETTGIIHFAKGNITYLFEPQTRIQEGDLVVVVPLIPCGSCKVCIGGYGENYCMSSHFMASNASGSLRTLYKYYKDLLLRIPENVEEKYALLTEPMSVAMQALMEFGFKEDSFEFDIAFKNHTQIFSYFHVPSESFTQIFNAITAAEPNPRTVYFLDIGSMEKNYKDQYYISIYNIQRKGLAIYGGEMERFLNGDNKLKGDKPRILILGSGTMGYLLTLLLSKVYKIPRERLYVTGQTDWKLSMFKEFAQTRNVKIYYRKENPEDINLLIHELSQNVGLFDIVFDCVGHYAMAKNIHLAMKLIREKGCIGIIGLEESNQPINFSLIKEKKIYLKGFYRGSLEAYNKSLNCIANIEDLKKNLDQLLGDIHEVSSETQLKSVFECVEERTSFGRHIVKLI